MRTPRRFVIVSLIALACGVPAARAADRYVAEGGAGDGSSWESPAGSLHDGVQGVTAGATVWVSNGTYTLTNQVTVTNFVVKSFNSGAVDRDGTIINGNNFPGKEVTNRCFLLNHANALVEGLTITNGVAIGNGGGVSISAGTLKNCRVQWNTATNGSGGGVYAAGSGSVITNCEIVSNQALWAASPDAGGGGVKLASAASLVNSRILYNNSPIYWTGGGGVNAGGGSLVANCHIISNKLGAQYAPGTAWGGGGVWASGANAVILRNCLILGNGGGNQERGAGVGTMSGSADIQNCTVLRNFGSGIGTDRASTYRVVNTISYYNSGVDMTSVGGTLNASNCILGSTNTITGGSDNSTEPPAFRQWAGGDYRLAPWSYGVDAGLVMGWMGAAGDLAGEPRLSPNNLVDIGAYETTAGGPPTVYYVAREGQTPVPPYTNGWAAAASNVADAVGVVSDGATILVSNGWYPQDGELTVGYFTLRSCKDGVADPDGTVLVGGYPAVSNRCMTLNHVKARVEGVTITNFYSPTNGGGGVYMTAGTLANCRITGNTATNANGGGVFATGTVSVITNCRIIANLVMYSDGANIGRPGGGGVGLIGGAQVWDSLIQWNQAPLYAGAGGGVNSSGGLIFNCSIISNTVADGWTAGGVWCATIGATTTVRNCLIAGNNGGRNNSFGAGISSMDGVIAVVENCTVVSNFGRGLGARNAAGTTYRVLNTISYFNTYDSMYPGPTGILIATNCCAGDTNYITGGSGNFTNDPRVVDRPGNNFRLAGDSPCLNAGVIQDWMAGARDRDGGPRIDGFNRMVDVGCYESFSKGVFFKLR